MLTKLPSSPDYLLVTDLDSDGDPELLVAGGEDLQWIRSPFEHPKVISMKGCYLFGSEIDFDIPLKSIPVLHGGRLWLLRWRENKFVFEPLPPFDKVDQQDIRQNFVAAYHGAQVWVYTPISKGEWKFANKFEDKSFQEHPVHSSGYVHALADLDRDSKLDAVCLRWHPGEWAWVLWGKRKEAVDLGTWVRYGYPLVADLDGDGWEEIATIASEPTDHLAVFRFDPERGRLRVIVKSLPLNLGWGTFVWDLFDLDGDKLKEIVLLDKGSGEWFVFKLCDGELKIWQGPAKGRMPCDGFLPNPVKSNKCNYLVAWVDKKVWLIPPRIWIENRRLRWKWSVEIKRSIFWELPKGKKALSPKHWRKHEAPFNMLFAADVDGDGNDEIVGENERGQIWLYHLRRTKTGDLEWQRIGLLGKGKQLANWALLKDRERRGLVIAWNNGTAELLEKR